MARKKSCSVPKKKKKRKVAPKEEEAFYGALRTIFMGNTVNNEVRRMSAARICPIDELVA
jgi:hypothetical protein